MASLLGLDQDWTRGPASALMAVNGELQGEVST
jgi:hypothetical protein